jgi:hypothetical protein
LISLESFLQIINFHPNLFSDVLILSYLVEDVLMTILRKSVQWIVFHQDRVGLVIVIVFIHLSFESLKVIEIFSVCILLIVAIDQIIQISFVVIGQHIDEVVTLRVSETLTESFLIVA